MKSLAISLILCTFLISCSSGIRPYKEKNCSWVFRRQAAIKEEVKHLKKTEKYKKETKQLILFSPIIIPLLIILPSGTYGSYGKTESMHVRVQDLEREYSDLQTEYKCKQCLSD